MSIYKKKNSKTVNYKSKLEYKLYLAREDPEPIFDISDCGLKAVPAGIYSLCKVFRKYALYMQMNSLSSLSGGGRLCDLSLLTTLDLHDNQLSSLPNDIRFLENLKELYVNNNQLRSLPEGLCELRCLRLLNVSANRLRCLPESIGHLSSLQQLSVDGNPSLHILPTPLCLAFAITSISLDPHHFTYPPQSVAEQGTFAIMKFLSQEIGVNYSGAKTTRTNGDRNSKLTTVEHSEKHFEKETMLEGKLKQFQNRKDEKLKDTIAVEKGMLEQKEKEYEVHSMLKSEKVKFLEDMVEQQNKIENEVTMFQNQRQTAKVKLINQLHEAQESADQVIRQLFSQLKQPNQSLELERKQSEHLFNQKSQAVRRKEVIEAMESLLAEELLRIKHLQTSEATMRAEFIKVTVTRAVEWEQQVCAAVCERYSRQSALVAVVAADEASQRAAVAALLERSDAHTIALHSQVALVERQLATLTALEAQHRKLNTDQLLVDLSEQRVALSQLLVELLGQQEERRKQLLQTLNKMEKNKLDTDTECSDFWLLQYQHLLDSSPGSMLRDHNTLDPALVQQLVHHNVLHCLPRIAHMDPTVINDVSLSQVGVNSESERAAILKALRVYSKECTPQAWAPSAPPHPSTSQSLPSAPLPTADTYLDSECVICMHYKCEVVFVPCGHLCCCISCSSSLSLCPLCRGQLERKIRVWLPT